MAKLEADFKNALQALTTTCVKAELVKGSDEAAFAELRTSGFDQWRLVIERRALMEAGPKARGHRGWFEKTIQRAEALFGPLPPLL